MVLSDRTIKLEMAAGRIVVEPCRSRRHPAVERRPAPGRRLPGVPQLALPLHRSGVASRPGSWSGSSASPEEPFVLHPGEFALGTTIERIGLPDDIVGRLEGKSSLGRLGLLIHSTAGYVDPGWDGHAHARALQRRQPADRADAGDDDRPDLVLADDDVGGSAVRAPRTWEPVSGPARGHAEQDVPRVRRATSS